MRFISFPPPAFLDKDIGAYPAPVRTWQRYQHRRGQLRVTAWSQGDEGCSSTGLLLVLPQPQTSHKLQGQGTSLGAKAV